VNQDEKQYPCVFGIAVGVVVVVKKNYFIKNTFKVGLEKYMFG